MWISILRAIISALEQTIKILKWWKDTFQITITINSKEPAAKAYSLA